MNKQKKGRNSRHMPTPNFQSVGDKTCDSFKNQSYIWQLNSQRRSQISYNKKR